MEKVEEKGGVLEHLEENVVLLPLALAGVFALISFVLNLFGVSEETVTFFTQCSYYAYGWVFSFCIGISVKNNSHLKMDILPDKYPKALRKVTYMINDILGFVVMITMLVGSWMVLKDAIITGAENANAPGLPTAILYFAPLIGFFIGLLRAIQRAKGKSAKDNA